jgi:hypothetical protein
MGVNVGSVNDYAVQSFFVDAMKQSRHWGSPSSPWDEAAATDVNGWPTTDAGVVILCCTADASGKSSIPGTYALSFSGSATVGLVAGPGTVDGMSYDPVKNVSTATVTVPDSGAGTQLFLSFTATRRSTSSPVGSGVTGVSLIRPQTSPYGTPWWTTPGQVFTTPYLNLLKPFSVLRFMDFTATNNSPVTSWTQRTLPTAASQQSPGGAAWEYVAALANATGKDIWINLPDQVDQDYVTRLATLLHQSLNPTLHVYTEFSNEVWNYSFLQAGRNQANAEAIVAANPSSALALGCSDYASCRYEWGERLIGLRAAQIGEIFRSVYGADAARVRPVYATQLGQTYFVSLVMQMISTVMGPPSSFLYGLAQAPYWTGNDAADGLTPAQELSDDLLPAGTLEGAGTDPADTILSRATVTQTSLGAG